MSLTDYIIQQDSWLLGHMQDKMEVYVDSVLQAICKEESQAKHSQYAMLTAAQNTVSIGGTVGLGKGRLATATGEAWHVYKCKRMVVMAKDLDYCYNFLPVELDPPDRERMIEFEQQRQLAELKRLKLDRKNLVQRSEFQFFLEPYSHCLMTTAEEIPCVTQYASFWKNRLGSWVSATPGILPARAPTYLPEAQTEWRLPHLRQELDFSF